MISILFAGAVSMVLTLIGTRWAIKWLAKRGYGQEIRDDGVKSHHVKRGTPTMAAPCSSPRPSSGTSRRSSSR